MTTIFAFIFLVAVAIAASLLIILEQNLRRQDREEKNSGNVTVRMKRTLSAV